MESFKKITCLILFANELNKVNYVWNPHQWFKLMDNENIWLDYIPLTKREQVQIKLYFTVGPILDPKKYLEKGVLFFFVVSTFVEFERINTKLVEGET